MSRIFISHSSADNAQAIALGAWLKQNGWADYFLDLDPDRGIAAGERWLNAFMGAVRRCEAVIFLLSPAWAASHYCRHEVTAAKAQGKPIFGVIIGPLDKADLRVKEIKAEWQLCDIVGAPDARGMEQHAGVFFKAAGLMQLARGLHRVGLGPSSFPWPPSNEPEREPYQGLTALTELDAGIYFGRDADLVQALDQIRRIRDRGGVERLFVILGASGSGKSSFLRAGLLPRLDKDSEHFVVMPTIRPLQAVIGGQFGLLASLQGVLNGHLAQSHTVGSIDNALTPTQWSAWLAQLATPPAGTTQPRTVIVPIDQAEELFVPHGAAEAQRLLELLALPSVTAAPVLFVWTLRSDLWEKVQSRSELEKLTAEICSLPPMPPSEFKAVIEEPARRHGEALKLPVTIEALLVQRLVRDATDLSGGDTLPLLALALQLLYRRSVSDKGIALQLDDFAQGLKGLPGVIDKAAQAALAPLALSDAERDRQLRPAYTLLATVDPDTGAARRREARWSEFQQQAPEVQALVTRLVEARLLTRDVRQDAGQKPSETIEVAHEALLRQWEPMRQLTEEFAHSFRVIEIVHRDALQWNRVPTEEALQHRGERLREAERLLANPLLAGRFDAGDAAYLGACLQSADTGRLLITTVAALLATLLIASLVAAAMALQGRAAAAAAHDTAAAFLTESYAASDPTAAAITLRDVLIADRATQSARHFRFQARALLLTRAVFDGHASSINSIAFSPDGLTVLTTSADMTARLWRLDGTLIATLKGHEDEIQHGSFSPDGSKVLTASKDGTARLWLLDGTPFATLQGRKLALVLHAVFSPDGKAVLTASSDKTARLWRLDGTPIATLLGHKDSVWSAVFSPDGGTVLTASADKTARLWRLDGTPIATLQGHEDRVSKAVFSPDGGTVLTASTDKTARLWRLDGTPIATLQGHESWINDVVFSPDGSTVLTTSRDKTARLWRVDGKLITALEGHGSVVRRGVFSPDGSTVMTASIDGTARLWRLDGTALATLQGHESAVMQAVFSPDGGTLLTASTDKTARLWRLDGTAIEMLQGHKDAVQHVAFSPDGKVMLTASTDRTARIWRLDGTPIATLQGHEDEVSQAVFSPDGDTVLTASADKTARLWRLDGTPIVTLHGHEEGVSDVTFSPDGRMVLTASDDHTARLWRLDGTPIAVLRGHKSSVWRAVFSPGGDMVLTASMDGTARLWRVDGALIVTLQGHGDGVADAIFSPDGRTVLTASFDKTARLWDLNGMPVVTLQGHENSVLHVVFSPDGSMVLTASVDRTARLWRLNGAQIALLRGHNSSVTHAVFSPDGRMVLTASEDKDWIPRLWRLDGTLLTTLQGHEAEITHAAFSPEGSTVLTASEDKMARLWPLQEQVFIDRIRVVAKPCHSMNERRRAYPDESAAASAKAVADCFKKAGATN